MRPLVHLATLYATLFGTSSALVDPGGAVTVYVESAGYDKRTSGNGFSPKGCTPFNTRDNDLSSNSRWSCWGDILSHDDGCWIHYSFEVPLEVVEMRIAFYKGDENTRTLRVYTSEYPPYTTITSSGETSGYQTFPLDGKPLACIRLYLDDYEKNSDLRFSILEVNRFTIGGYDTDCSAAVGGDGAKD